MDIRRWQIRVIGRISNIIISSLSCCVRTARCVFHVGGGSFNSSINFQSKLASSYYGCVSTHFIVEGLLSISSIKSDANIFQSNIPLPSAFFHSFNRKTFISLPIDFNIQSIFARENLIASKFNQEMWVVLNTARNDKQLEGIFTLKLILFNPNSNSSPNFTPFSSL